MKHLLLLALLPAILSINGITIMSKNNLSGAWKLVEPNEELVLLFIDGYMTLTRYNQANKNFISTIGGPYTTGSGGIEVNIEFDTRKKERVGTKAQYAFVIDSDKLNTDIGGQLQSWSRIDDGKENLAGLWTITARQQGDKLVPIHQSGTRKTIKILSGSRFQWAAIDPGKKEFMGTGGGHYTFSDGKYVEHIEFFSRDSSRVGQSLSFEGKLEDGNWHHSGLSSRGEPIYEIWSRR